jgi:hypothetical protein
MRHGSFLVAREKCIQTRRGSWTKLCQALHTSLDCSKDVTGSLDSMSRIISRGRDSIVLVDPVNLINAKSNNQGERDVREMVARVLLDEKNSNLGIDLVHSLKMLKAFSFVFDLRVTREFCIVQESLSWGFGDFDRDIYNF